MDSLLRLLSYFVRSINKIHQTRIATNFSIRKEYQMDNSWTRLRPDPLLALLVAPLIIQPNKSFNSNHYENSSYKEYKWQNFIYNINYNINLFFDNLIIIWLENKGILNLVFDQLLFKRVFIQKVSTYFTRKNLHLVLFLY